MAAAAVHGCRVGLREIPAEYPNLFRIKPRGRDSLGFTTGRGVPGDAYPGHYGRRGGYAASCQ